MNFRSTIDNFEIMTLYLTQWGCTAHISLYKEPPVLDVNDVERGEYSRAEELTLLHAHDQCHTICFCANNESLLTASDQSLVKMMFV